MVALCGYTNDYTMCFSNASQTLKSVIGTNGSALFIFDDVVRTQAYDIVVRIFSGGEERVLLNSVRSGTRTNQILCRIAMLNY